MCKYKKTGVFYDDVEQTPLIYFQGLIVWWFMVSFLCEMCPARARHIVHFILVGPFGDSKFLEGELVGMSLIT
jgi:hypothetical protein